MANIKYSKEFMEIVVKSYLESSNRRQTALKFTLSPKTVERWVKAYEKQFVKTKRREALEQRKKELEMSLELMQIKKLLEEEDDINSQNSFLTAYTDTIVNK